MWNLAQEVGRVIFLLDWIRLFNNRCQFNHYSLACNSVTYPSICRANDIHIRRLKLMALLLARRTSLPYTRYLNRCAGSQADREDIQLGQQQSN